MVLWAGTSNANSAVSRVSNNDGNNQVFSGSTRERRTGCCERNRPPLLPLVTLVCHGQGPSLGKCASTSKAQRIEGHTKSAIGAGKLHTATTAAPGQCELSRSLVNQSSTSMQVNKHKAESPCPLMHSCAYYHTHWYKYTLDAQASTGRAA
jgi:hypothetical protein